jgi:long-chain acyl-CoA synthetase
VTEQEILDFCAERLDFSFQPKVVLFGYEVPFTATGKAKRIELKKNLSEELDRYRDAQFRRHRTAIVDPGGVRSEES